MQLVRRNQAIPQNRGISTAEFGVKKSFKRSARSSSKNGVWFLLNLLFVCYSFDLMKRQMNMVSEKVKGFDDSIIFWDKLKGALEDVFHQKSTQSDRCFDQILRQNKQFSDLRSCQKLLLNSNAVYKSAVISEWEFANPSFRIKPIDSSLIKMGATGEFEMGPVELKIDPIGTIKLDGLLLKYEPKDLEDFLGFKRGADDLYYIFRISLGSFVAAIYYFYNCIDSMKRNHEQDDQGYQMCYPFKSIEIDDSADANELFSDLGSFERFSEESKVRFLTQQLGVEALPRLLTESVPESIVLSDDTVRHVDGPPKKKKRKDTKVYHSKDKVPESLTINSLVVQHQNEMKKNNRQSFQAWGSRHGHPILFLGDYDRDEFNTVYNDFAKRKEAWNALGRIAVKSNQGGLKHIESNLFELKTVKGKSGGTRYFGGRAFPSKLKPTDGKVNVFYISLKKNHSLQNSARKK